MSVHARTSSDDRAPCTWIAVKRSSISFIARRELDLDRAEILLHVI
jgi:hypothetical protein